MTALFPVRPNNKSVISLQSLRFDGLVIPQEWLSKLTFDNGKPQTVACFVLADLLYWHTPVIERNEKTNRSTLLKRFRGDKLQRSYQQVADQYGFGKDQVRNAFDYLEEMGLICREFRTIAEGEMRLGNVMFVDIDVPNIILLTRSQVTPESTDSQSYTSDPIGLQPDTPIGFETDTPIGIETDRVENHTSRHDPPIGFETDTYTRRIHIQKPPSHLALETMHRTEFLSFEENYKRQEMVSVLCEVCIEDVLLNTEKYNDLADVLVSRGVKPEDIRRCYGKQGQGERDGWWWKRSFGTRGQRPYINNIRSSYTEAISWEPEEKKTKTSGNGNGHQADPTWEMVMGWINRKVQFSDLPDPVKARIRVFGESKLRRANTSELPFMRKDFLAGLAAAS